MAQHVRAFPLVVGAGILKRVVRGMASREHTARTWLGVAATLLAVAAIAGSRRLRYQLASAGDHLAELFQQVINGVRASMQPRYGRRMAAIQQMSGTMDEATTQLDSSMVVSKVDAALAREPRLRGRHIGVRMIGGILHLVGEVRTEEERALAGEVARRASGAELVANDVKVVGLVR